MKRQVECQSKVNKHTIGRGSTPEGGDLAPDIEKHEVEIMFYDIHETAHRNVYPLILTTEEAKDFKLGKTYTLIIE